MGDTVEGDAVRQEDDMPLRAVNAALHALALDEPADIVDAIAILYEAIAATSDVYLQDVSRFTEAQITEGGAERARGVADGVIAVALDGDNKAILLDAVRLLRALEDVAVELVPHLQSDRGEDIEAEWCTLDGRYFVIPRMTPHVPVDSKPFLRRALRHFRVIPTKVGIFDVRLHRTSSVAGASEARDEASKAQNYGAAFFPGLTVAISSPSETQFLVTGLGGFQAEPLIMSHLDEAATHRCVAVTWAELTMPDESVSFLKSEAARRTLDGGHACRFFVAGSWHRQVGAETYNICNVLDGYGETIFEVLKWARFSMGVQEEAIAVGKELHVLVGEEDLAVVAICKDFLQETSDIPYKKLNVDIAIVPSMTSSMSDQDTVPGHAATAQAMRVRWGTRTLVVAQPAVPSRDPSAGVGRVLAFPAKPLRDPVGELVSASWRVCVLD